MTVKDLLNSIILDTRLGDTVLFYDMDVKEFKQLEGIERIGNSLCFKLSDEKKNDMALREDFFKDA